MRRKKVGEHAYYQIVESRRVEGVPRQRVILHLGGYSSVEEALREWPEDVEVARGAAEESRESYEAYLPPTAGRSHLEEEARHLRRADKLRGKLEVLRDLVERGVVEESAEAKERVKEQAREETREEQHGEEG
jgi:hypothetical protein